MADPLHDRSDTDLVAVVVPRLIPRRLSRARVEALGSRDALFDLIVHGLATEDCDALAQALLDAAESPAQESR